MSGAKLEAVGQLRDIYPHLIMPTIQIIGSSSDIAQELYAPALPFVEGPDMSARVFVCIHSVSIIVVPSVIDPTESYNAIVAYDDKLGNRHVLACLAGNFSGPQAQCVQPMALINTPIYEAKGTIGTFRVIGSYSVPADVYTYVNVGIYGEYKG
jgi:hypothetical protein